MTWLAFAFALELGVQPFGTLRAYEPLVPAANEWTFYQKAEARVYLWDLLFAEGQVEIYDWRDRDLSFWPDRAGFEVGAGLRWKILEIGFRHYCTHPIIPRFSIPASNWRWEGGYEEIYLRLEGKIGGRKDRKE